MVGTFVHEIYHRIFSYGVKGRSYIILYREQMVNDKFPLSNSCGQLGMSYQDMHCEEEEAHMECPVKLDMEQYALTSALWFQAPGPFRCGPKSKFPITGYW